MAELIDRLQYVLLATAASRANIAGSALQALPPEQHLFCPRCGDDNCYFAVDRATLPPDQPLPAEYHERIDQADETRLATLHALQILAFNGDEAAPLRQWLSTRLHTLFTSCDVCIRVFHVSRAEWRQTLLEYVAPQALSTQLTTGKIVRRGRRPVVP